MNSQPTHNLPSLFLPISIPYKNACSLNKNFDNLQHLLTCSEKKLT